MSVKIRKSLVASALVGAFAFASNSVIADPLKDIQNAEGQTIKAAQQSQNKIDNLFGQTIELKAEYDQAVTQTEILKVYNDHLARLVADQNSSIESLNKQIGEIDTTKRNVVPLMYRMIETLEQFIKADVPFETEKRLARVEKLRELMTNSSVATSEKYRQVLETYLAEKDHSTVVDASQGKLLLDGKEITVDFARVGRVAYVAQSLDLKNAWVWNNTAKQWDALGEEYLKPVTDLIRMARKQKSYDLVQLPIFGAE
jgi:septal ring factor EnvC (AmiA/AmiB activator)